MLEKHSIHAWLAKYAIKTENGNVFDLRNHAFWFDILSDWHAQQVWLKAAQVGGSLVANLKLLWAVKNKGINAIYTLPTSHDVKEFVGGKTNLLISQNPILQEWVQDKDTIEQKRIGNNVVYFRGTFTERQALSVSSDLNIHDEVDRSDKLIVDQYSSRQQHSPFKWQWHFSNPSLVGAGVDEKWKLSDQREWFISCSHCGTNQPLVWPDSVDFARAMYVCVHCKRDIGNDRRRGEWHATSDKTEWRGYHVSLLMAPWVTPQYLIRESQTKTKEYFWNFVLGLPYEGAGGRLSEEQFFANLTSDVNTQEKPIVIGLDTGLPNWYVVGNRQGIFFNGSCDGYGEIEQMLKRWPQSILVVDQGGDLHGPRELQERYPGRVYLCYFRSDRKTVSLIDWGKGLEAGRVLVDRNRTIQMLMDEWRLRRIPIFGTKEEWFEMWTHLSNMYRVMEKDIMGQPRYVWERSGADHLILACFTGDTLITREDGHIPIKDIKVGDYVLTREGFRRVRFSGITRLNADIIEVSFSNGSILTGTPDHKVWTENRGWTELRHLNEDDILVGIWNNHSTEQNTISRKEKHICGQKKVEKCIEPSGNFITGKFLKDFMSITKIMSEPTMRYQILNYFGLATTQKGTQVKKFYQFLYALFVKNNTNRTIREQTSIAQSVAVPESTEENITKWRGDVASVKNDFPPILIGGVPHVLKHVQTKRSARAKRKHNSKEIDTEGLSVVSHIKYLKNKETVYGITVDDMHEYFANGILVKNCLYWRVGMDKFGASEAKFALPKPDMSEKQSFFDPDTKVAKIPKDFFLREHDWRDTGFV